MLINGKNNYPCGNATVGQTCTPNAGLASFKFQSGKKHRLRLINHAAGALLFFSIDGYEMTVIANDFVPVEPYRTDLVIMGVGQRTDIIVTGKNNPKEAVLMRVSEGPSGLGPQGQTGCSLNTGVSIEAIAPIYYEDADTTIIPNTTSSIDPSRYLFPQNCGNQPLDVTVPAYAMEVKEPDKILSFVMTGGYNGTGAFVCSRSEDSRWCCDVIGSLAFGGVRSAGIPVRGHSIDYTTQRVLKSILFYFNITAPHHRLLVTMSSQESTINPRTNKPYSANYYTQLKLAQALPVSQHIDALLKAISENVVTIVVADTGSGKTTQLPKAIVLSEPLRKSERKVVVTQPRRLAADGTSKRIAEELDVELGDFVGVKYRGINRVKPETRLEVVTDGTLLAAATRDPTLCQYGVIIVDEAHQHTTDTDLLLGLLKELAQSRKDDLKIIIMSATIDTERFKNYFAGSVVMPVPGKAHEVDIRYLKKPVEESRMDVKIASLILQIHLTEDTGNILVFVPGVGLIDSIITSVANGLREYAVDDVGELDCYPLYGTQSSEEQDLAVEAVAPASRNGKPGRKVVISTNIAETSVTLTGMVYVVDSLMMKSKEWNPRNESQWLRAKDCSKATAKQRAGRVGRTRPGIVYRMCTQEAFETQLIEHAVPAILSSDMLSECVSIKKLGRDPLTFPYIERPASETIAKALGILQQFGAINVKGELTTRGEQIGRLPIDVYPAAMLLDSARIGCSDEIITIVSMLEATEGIPGQCFVRPKTKEEKAKLQRVKRHFSCRSGDHIMLLNIYMAWRTAEATGTTEAFLLENLLAGSVPRSAHTTRMQLVAMLTALPEHEWKLVNPDPSHPEYYAYIMKGLSTGSFTRIAKRDPFDLKRYTTVSCGAEAEFALDVDISPAPEWVMYHEFTGSQISCVSPIPAEHLIATMPEYWREAELKHHGHVKDGLIKAIAKMTGQSEAVVRGGMPKPSSAPSTSK
ncbi:hypothetical protein LTR78_004014 [Recurvomyces mirabilis]|uniref:RNA helicase n=1 Tax=Recurvomyces mirabilis TaxID=574656 RepID=A0AAE0WQR1_9PEZI|nr:hypothetical protein LTR78_004014 [Recurvomyces mirabilis]KAK5153847.1 DEAH-box ATP-dependent RNA helicase prp43 [Recurvomyces mirabilis]